MRAKSRTPNTSKRRRARPTASVNGRTTERRVNTDSELRRIGCSNLQCGFREALKQWERATDKAMGAEPLTAFDRRCIRDEVRWGHRWLRDLDRAIELKLPEAAAYCAVSLTKLILRLNEQIDVLPERNMIVLKHHEDRRKGGKNRHARTPSDDDIIDIIRGYMGGGNNVTDAVFLAAEHHPGVKPRHAWTVLKRKKNLLHSLLVQ
ncbi:MAG: hypothetical protein ACREJC_15085 [Tepidisphaeraceae bacterium]